MPIPTLNINNLAVDLMQINRLADAHDTVTIHALDNGLFPAAKSRDSNRKYTNYHYVWVRDNVHVAHQFLVTGETQQAVRAVDSLCTFFEKSKVRFFAIINGDIDPHDEMKRPHVRFDGDTLSEVNQRWNHKQNDALGYFVWLFTKLALANAFQPTDRQLQTLALFPRLFQAIEYWRDEDSGHWEEWPKIEASSIGVVVGGLKQLRELMQNPDATRILETHGVTTGLVDELIQYGEQALGEILPSETVVGPESRSVDAALLFLIYPIDVLQRDVADEVLDRVLAELKGPLGIARYKNDTFWSPDYKQQLDESKLTDAVADDDGRREIVVKDGEEAQWCIFDPIVSCIYGRRFLDSGDRDDLERQVEYLNRALGQLTDEGCPLGDFQCPEAYYLENGQWVPNDSTPLLWTQANLRLALHFAELSAREM